MDDGRNLVAPLSPDEKRIRIKYDGKSSVVIAIAIINTVLSVLTLGIYRFWAKTRFRRYFWGHIEIADDRLEYSGKGGELALGFLVALLVLAPIVIIDGIAEVMLEPASALRVTEQVAYGLVFWLLFNVALFRARRFRLTRTRWRGLRFTQSGKALSYAVRMMGWQLLMLCTLFLAFPFYRAARQRFLTNNTLFGESELNFTGEGKPLALKWLITWILVLPTLGLSFVWYRVKEFNYFASETHFDGVNIDADLSAGRAIRIVLVSQLVILTLLGMLIGSLVVLTPELLAAFLQVAETSVDESTLGIQSLIAIGISVIFISLMGIARMVLFVHPMIGAVTNSISIKGEVDYDQLTPASDVAPRRGEGLLDTLDVGEV